MACFRFFKFLSLILMVKSALWDLTFVTQCKLGIPATYYIGYGCHCGVGGAGSPIDGIDECCMRHDKCYDNARDSLACSHLYIQHYSYTCLNNETICYDNQDKCKDALCQCDKTVVECWSQYPILEQTDLLKSVNKSCNKDQNKKSF